MGALEAALRQAGKGYVLGVNANSQFHSWGKMPAFAGTAEEIAKGLDASAWQRLSAGDGTKGSRLYDWAYCELADLETAEYKVAAGLWTRGLLIRRNIADGALVYFSPWCPVGTSTAKPVEVEGRRWAIEDSFETTKMNSASTTTRHARTVGGIGTSCSSCSLLPWWQRSATRFI